MSNSKKIYNGFSENGTLFGRAVGWWLLLTSSVLCTMRRLQSAWHVQLIYLYRLVESATQ